MPDALKYVIDAVVGLALFFALLVVFVVDRFLLTHGAPVAENTLTVNVIRPETREREAKKLKLAVTPTGGFKDILTQKIDKWDDMSKLLDELGEGFRHDQLTVEQMINPRKLAEYDVVFLTCNDGFEQELKPALVNFVTNGGILYASDRRYNAVANAFPEMAVPEMQIDGDKQKLKADIVDEGLRDELKTNTIDLHFDLPEWRPAAFGGPRVKVLMKGNYLKLKGMGERTTAPLMVKFSVGKGTVIFTSFHNEKQSSRTEKQLLQYLVYSLVTAGVDAEVTGKMEEGGFKPQRSNLLSTPANQTTEPKTYKNEKVGTLRFALGFRNEGAKLRFHIKSPDGKQYTEECTSTVILEVPNAAPGDWTYSVTAVSLPHPNFPFTITVGEKK